MLKAIKLAIPPEKTTNTKLESAIIYQNTLGAQVLLQMHRRGKLEAPRSIEFHYDT